MSLSSVQVLAGTGRPPEEKTHFTATLVLEKAEGEEKAPVIKAAAMGEKAKDEPRIGREDIYKVYFHGPAYQVLSEVIRHAGEAVAGQMATGLPQETADALKKTLFAPRLIELCFQTAGVWELGSTGQLGLPAAIKRVKVWGTPKEGMHVVAEVSVREGGGREGLSFDAKVHDARGHVYVELEGYETSQLPGTLPEDKLAPFKSVAGS
jgi:hypothetical protein